MNGYAKILVPVSPPQEVQVSYNLLKQIQKLPKDQLVSFSRYGGDRSGKWLGQLKSGSVALFSTGFVFATEEKAITFVDALQKTVRELDLTNLGK